MTMIEAMEQRRSIRRYDPRPLSADERKAVEEALAAAPAGPFGRRPRLVVVSLDPTQAGRPLRLATYGTIRGASLFVVGAVERGPGAHEDFGYSLERVILELTRHGLGTCWLGGIFRRGSFAQRIELQSEEELPAATPVGPPARRQDLSSRAIAGVVRARTRKPWAELFFRQEPAGPGKRARPRSWTPLEPEAAGAYRTVLECVRIAPSASNRQPWRIVRDGSTDAYHIFLQRTPGYRRLTATDLQRLDMGIAMCHFECAARELGLTGEWRILPEPPSAERRPPEYIATWVTEHDPGR